MAAASRQSGRSGGGRSVIRADCVSRPRWASNRHGLPSRTNSDSKMPSPRTTARSSAWSKGGAGSCSLPSSVTTTAGWLAMGKKRSPRKVEDMFAVPAPDTGPDAGSVWHYGDPLGERRAAADAAIVVDRSHRTVLTVTGNDRKTWLHSISSQHVSDLPDGAVTQNLSLDGQGRVEDHWIQTQLDGVTSLDPEPWRGEPLLTYLRKMVFWSDVAVEPADLAVLSLLGPRLAEPQVLDAIGVGSLPADKTAVALPDGGFVRRMPGPSVAVDLVVPRA